MIQLTPEQADLLHRESMPQFVDPTTNEVYVVISGEMFRRLQQYLEDDREQAAWRELSRRGKAAFLKDNPPAL